MDTDLVRSLVGTVLRQAPAFDGQNELLAQAATVEVVAGTLTRLELSVDRSLPPAPLIDGPVPGSCWARATDGTPIGTLLLWANDGYIGTLEFRWVTVGQPTELPDPTALHTDAGGSS